MINLNNFDNEFKHYRPDNGLTENELSLDLTYIPIDIEKEYSIQRELYGDCLYGYYPLYMEPGVYVSPSLSIYSVHNGAITEPINNIKGYANIHFVNEWYHQRVMGIHRALLLAFRPVAEYESLVVNHIDGDPTNNRLDNLEWCTNRLNIVLGYENGYNSKKVKGLIVRDIRDNSIKHYDTITEYAKSIGVTKDAIRHRLLTPNSIWNSFFQYKRPWDTSPWPEVTEELLLNSLSNSNSKAVKVRLITQDLDYEEFEFKTQYDAAKHLNLSVAKLSMHLNNLNCIYSLDGYKRLIQVKWLSDPNPWVNPTNYWLAYSEADGNVVISVVVYPNGVYKIYKELTDIVNDTGVKKSTLCYRMNLAKPTPWSDGNIYLYYKDWLKYFGFN